MSYFKHLMVATCAVAAFVGVPAVANATPFTAFELLADAPPYDVGAPSVTRTYGSSLGDAGSGPATSVDGNFGVVTWEDVTYSHDVSFLLPATFSSASLTIKAWGNVGGDDRVVTETVNFLLNNSSLFSGLFSTTVFGNSALLTALNVDGTLQVTIDKNVNGWGFLNPFSVYSSRLDVAGDTIVRQNPVPEPTSLALFGTLLVGAAARLRRRQ